MNFPRVSFSRRTLAWTAGSVAALAAVATLSGASLKSALELCAAPLATAFMPHGGCYFWQPGLVSLHAVSDSMIALSYFSIPIALFYYAAKRREARFGPMFALFGSFIGLCGMTHAMEIYNIWNAAYWQAGALKLATGVVSIATAVTLARSMPTVLKIPLPEEMQRLTSEVRVGARYKLLAEFMYSATWVADEKGKVRGSTGVWSAFTGQPAEEAWDSGWIEMIAADYRPAFKSAWDRSIETGEPFEFETLLWRRSSGAYVPVLAKAMPILGADGKIAEWVGAVNDLTEFKRQEELLASYARRLSAKNKALEEFASAASHDMQEPLRKILAYGDILKEDLGPHLTAESAGHVAVMQSAAKRMSRLVEDLMAYSRASVKRLTLTKVNLNEAMHEVLADCEISIEESGAAIEVGELPVIESDRSLTGVVLLNIVTNALKYRRKDAPPRIVVSARPRRKSELGAFGERLPSERYWEIEIADNGIGFDPSQAENIFKAFLRLHGPRDYPGTGIGLAMCAQAVERLGGGIRAESEPGAGSRFFVYFRAT